MPYQLVPDGTLLITSAPTVCKNGIPFEVKGEDDISITKFKSRLWRNYYRVSTDNFRKEVPYKLTIPWHNIIKIIISAENSVRTVVFNIGNVCHANKA